ncbi:MAG: leucine-rich repeat domain-containing protein [Paludibacteraceae bacterium]|nr:leucine-rich repeat domain-containing protein [Paludibacteraceae bacterium]
MKNKFFLATALLFFTFASWASDISVDGIWYTFNRTNITATVSYRGASYSTYSNEYTGSVVIPSTITYNDTVWRVTSIGAYTFYGCKNLTSVTFSNTIDSIGNQAFYGCTSLLSVSIPNSVTSIGSYAFNGCTSLLYANIPKSVTQIPSYLFKNCRSLTSILIPNTIVSIGTGAFEGCSKLSSITIPSSVTSVGTSVFSGCSVLSSVYISHNPAMVFERVSNTTYDSYGNNLFKDCTSLRTIYNYNTKPQKINTNSTNGTFLNVDKSLCTLYVPSTAVEAYRAATGWKDFTNIEAVPDLTITVSAEHATTFGTGSYPMTQNAVIAVTADDGWRFVRWSDGNTDNPRIVTVTGNATYTAVMEKTSFTIRVGQDCNVTVE